MEILEEIVSWEDAIGQILKNRATDLLELKVQEYWQWISGMFKVASLYWMCWMSDVTLGQIIHRWWGNLNDKDQDIIYWKDENCLLEKV